MSKLPDFIDNATDAETAQSQWQSINDKNESTYIRASHAYRSKKISKEAYDREKRTYRSKIEELNEYAARINIKFGTDLPFKKVPK